MEITLMKDFGKRLYVITKVVIENNDMGFNMFLIHAAEL